MKYVLNLSLSLILSMIFSAQTFASSKIDDDYKKEISFILKNKSNEDLHFETNSSHQHCQDSTNESAFDLHPGQGKRLYMTAYLCGGDTSWLRYMVSKKDSNLGLAEIVVNKWCSVSTCRFLNVEGRTTTAAVAVEDYNPH